MFVGGSSCWLCGVDGGTQLLWLHFSHLWNGKVVPSSQAMERERIKEASKDPAAPGEGVLALGPLAGHQGPKGAGWPPGAGGQSP